MITVSRTVLTLLALLASGPPPSATTLRVMTFNIHAGHGDLQRTAGVIRDARPDVVALQEVDAHWGERSGFLDQVSELAAATGMEARFGPIYRLPGATPDAPVREYGVAILSRRPIATWQNHAITRLSTQGDEPPLPMPGFLQVTVVVDGRGVDVFSTHLDFRPDADVRRAQVADMLAVLVRGSRPAILLGDLNAGPDADELRPLFRRLDDAWLKATALEAGTEAPAAHGGPTYPADAPNQRIDYVLVSPGLRVLSARVVPTNASDHLPVVVDLEIPGA